MHLNIASKHKKTTMTGCRIHGSGSADISIDRGTGVKTHKHRRRIPTAKRAPTEDL
jgi:hypothetical protein